MSHRIEPLFENISESALACLLTMVQGNLLALSASHWLIAAETGIVAGTLTSVALALVREQRRSMISFLLGVVTAGVDFWVHPGQFGPVVLEAVVTGLGAALLSYLVSGVLQRIRKPRLVRA